MRLAQLRRARGFKYHFRASVAAEVAIRMASEEGRGSVIVHRFELRPNSSLSPRAACVFYLSVAAVSLGIATSFAMLGYWPILPFAGLELLGLGAAMLTCQRRAQAREYISVDAHSVVVSKRGPGWKRDYRLARPWTRVDLQAAGVAHWPSRLLLRCSGRSVEVGTFLTEDERRGLRARLREVIMADPGKQAAGPGQMPIDRCDGFIPGKNADVR
jgi:uncharacterized membrane protein